jgi:hypothetical protein
VAEAELIRFVAVTTTVTCLWGFKGTRRVHKLGRDVQGRNLQRDRVYAPHARGCNRPQSLANRVALETAKTSKIRCHRLPPVA